MEVTYLVDAHYKYNKGWIVNKRIITTYSVDEEIKRVFASHA